MLDSETQKLFVTGTLHIFLVQKCYLAKVRDHHPFEASFAVYWNYIPPIGAYVEVRHKLNMAKYMRVHRQRNRTLSVLCYAQV